MNDNEERLLRQLNNIDTKLEASRKFLYDIRGMLTLIFFLILFVSIFK